MVEVLGVAGDAYLINSVFYFLRGHIDDAVLIGSRAHGPGVSENPCKFQGKITSEENHALLVNNE